MSEIRTCLKTKQTKCDKFRFLTFSVFSFGAVKNNVTQGWAGGVDFSDAMFKGLKEGQKISKFV